MNKSNSTIEWPEEEIKVLESFCLKHGIVGFDCGRMSPLAALSLLKSKLGVIDAPLEERFPYGNKIVLHG